MRNKDKQTIERLEDTFYQNNAKGIKRFQKVTLYEEGIEDILSLLNMVEEKDKIINEQLKENIKLQSELNEENNRCMILANNDKFKEQIIDLMAEKLAKAYHYKMNECSLKKKEQNNIDCNKYKDCTICVKQYFANKVNSSEQK